MLGPIPPVDIVPISVTTKIGLLTDILAPAFRGLLEDLLAKLKPKDLPKINPGQMYVFQFTQDFGAIYSLYAGVVVKELPKEPSIAKRAVVIKVGDCKGDLFYLVDENLFIRRRLDKGAYMVIKCVKPKAYMTVLGLHLIAKIRDLKPKKKT